MDPRRSCPSMVTFAGAVRVRAALPTIFHVPVGTHTTPLVVAAAFIAAWIAGPLSVAAVVAP